MLEAERAALATEAYHNSLSILEREMGVLLQYLTNIGTQAALLGGFVFGSLATEVVKAGEDGQVAAWFEGLFLGASAFSFGMMMYTVLISTLSASLGPTMALKGKDGSAMPVEISIRRIEIGGRSLILSISRDLTERKRLEEEEAARPKVSGAKLKACLELLSAEAGFLVEKKVRDALDELPEDEAELAQAESLLRALGARDDADISLLVSKFFSDGPADTEGEGDAAARALATRIKPEDVVGAAQSFVEERRRNAALKPPAADTVIGAEPVGLAAEREKERHAKQREYWTKMANVVSDDTFEVWQELEKQLEKYNTVLKQRSQEIARVTSLQEQNAQLKALINQYLNAKVNDELIVPPAATIAMNQQAAQTSAEG